MFLFIFSRPETTKQPDYQYVGRTREDRYKEHQTKLNSSLPGIHEFGLWLWSSVRCKAGEERPDWCHAERGSAPSHPANHSRHDDGTNIIRTSQSTSLSASSHFNWSYSINSDNQTETFPGNMILIIILIKLEQSHQTPNLWLFPSRPHRLLEITRLKYWIWISPKWQQFKLFNFWSCVRRAEGRGGNYNNLSARQEYSHTLNRNQGEWISLTGFSFSSFHVNIWWVLKAFHFKQIMIEPTNNQIGGVGKSLGIHHVHVISDTVERWRTSSSTEEQAEYQDQSPSQRYGGKLEKSCQTSNSSNWLSSCRLERGVMKYWKIPSLHSDQALDISRECRTH